MSFVGRPKPKRIFKSTRVGSPIKYSISTDPPMDASLFKSTKLPTKLEAAKLHYDIVAEESAQTRLTSDINTLAREMNNEHLRYRTRKRKSGVRGESELVTQSPTYSMLKRQKETLQRAQQASFSKLSNLKSKKGVSLNPIQKATKSFRGISNRNPMLKPTRYLPVVPGSSRNPLSGLGTPSRLIPQAFATSAWGGRSGSTSTLAQNAEMYYGFKRHPPKRAPKRKIKLVLVQKKAPKKVTKKVKKKAKKKKTRGKR